MKQKTKTTLSLLIVAIMLTMTFGICEAASKTLKGAQVSPKNHYTYDGKEKGPNSYKVTIKTKNGSKKDITKKVKISQKKHTNCGTWYVKVTAKKGKGYKGHVMCRAFTIFPKKPTIDSISYNSKNNTTILKVKMPALKHGYCSYVLYCGKQKKEPFTGDDMIKIGKTKEQKWKNGQIVPIKINKKLDSKTYRIAVEVADQGYTNIQGSTKESSLYGSGSVAKTFTVN